MTAKFTVTCSDGRLLAATQFNAATPSNNQFIIINSALGVRQSFYQALATYLSGNGYTVITWDPRGIGKSSMENIKKDPAQLRDWGTIDLEAILNHVIDTNQISWDNITLLGHSAGGHLVGLCPSINKINQMILVSAGTCSWRLYAIKQWPKMWFAWYLLMPFLIKLLGYIPSKLGVGHDLPKGIALDWRNWSTKQGYLFSDSSLTNTFYQEYDGKIHSIGFSDDVGFSPKATVYDLMHYFPNANKEIQIFHPQELGKKHIGHFGFFKQNNQTLWEKLILRKLNKSNNQPDPLVVNSDY